jgi:hypothetical protein
LTNWGLIMPDAFLILTKPDRCRSASLIKLTCYLKALVLVVVGDFVLSLRDIGFTENSRSRLRRGCLGVAVAGDTGQKEEGR